LDGTSRGDGRSSSGILLLNDYLVFGVFVPCAFEGVFVRVVVAVRVEGMSDVFGYFVGSLGNTLTKRMILALVVVISHITLELLGGVASGTSSLFYSNLSSSWITAINLVGLATRRVAVLGSEGLFGVAGLGNDGTSAFAELALTYVDLGGSKVGGWAVD